MDLGALVDQAGFSSTATSINLEGQVVGGSSTIDPLTHAVTVIGFLYSRNGGMQTFMAPGCSYTAPSSINNAGQVVGIGYVPLGSGQEQRAFLRQPNGTIATLDFFGGIGLAAYAINDWGQIAGSFPGADGLVHAFVTQAGGARPKDLGNLPGGLGSEAVAINDLGQVLIQVFYGPFSDGAFLYAGGKVHDLGTLPGYADISAVGLNNWGQIVGGAANLSVPPTGWVYLQGQMRDLNRLLSPAARGWVVTGASSINDVGQIIATAIFNNGLPHAVILNPRYW
jgi:probable HAF family extracellular repeat protein